MILVERWSAWRSLVADRRLIITFALGIASGMPLLLIGSTLTWRLASEGIDKTTIGLFALAGMPYALKFLWAPLIDHGRWPLLDDRFGRRRAWMIVILPLLAISILVLGTMDPRHAIGATALVAVAVSSFSATFDIIVDAYRIEIFAPREQGKGAATTQLGYRIGLLISGAGALFASHQLEWAWVFSLMSMILLAFGMLALVISGKVISGKGISDKGIGGNKHTHHPVPPRPARLNLHEIIIAPLKHFMDGCTKDTDRWRGLGIMLSLLVAIILYRASDAIAGMMANAFYYDLGFQAAEVASVSKIFGLIATFLGIIAGAWLVSRRGLIYALLLCGVLQMLSNAMFAILAMIGRDMSFFMATIAIENVSGGMASAAFVAFLSALCRRQWAATQYALLSALSAVGRTLFSSGGGWIVDHFGWIDFFLATIIASLPALVIFAALSQRLQLFIADHERSFIKESSP